MRLAGTIDRTRQVKDITGLECWQGYGLSLLCPNLPLPPFPEAPFMLHLLQSNLPTRHPVRLHRRHGSPLHPAHSGEISFDTCQIPRHGNQPLRFVVLVLDPGKLGWAGYSTTLSLGLGAGAMCRISRSGVKGGLGAQGVCPSHPSLA